MSDEEKKDQDAEEETASKPQVRGRRLSTSVRAGTPGGGGQGSQGTVINTESCCGSGASTWSCRK